MRVGGHLRGDIDEIFFLRLIDLRTELQIDRQQPPIARQLQREITAGLSGLAAGEAARGSAKRARERDQTVVPVVVAGQRKHARPTTCRIERGRIRLFGALLIRLAGRIGVDLIAAEHEHLTTAA